MLDSTKSVFILICICTAIGLVPKSWRAAIAAILGSFYYLYETGDASVLYISIFAVCSLIPHATALLENRKDKREPRKIKNFTLTEAYKKTPCGAKGFNKLYITMTELTQAASY